MWAAPFVAPISELAARRLRIRNDYRVPTQWTDAAEHDPGMALVELLAYVDDMLSYYQDRVAEENRIRARVFTACALGALLFLFFWGRRKPDDD